MTYRTSKQNRLDAAVEGLQSVRGAHHPQANQGEVLASNSEECGAMPLNFFFDTLRFALSHEMSACVRTLGGFSQIIQTKYKEHLPPEVIKMLSLINESSLDMQALMSALLDFLHLARHTMHKERVNVNSVVQKILDTYLCSPPYKDQPIEIICHELPACVADIVLITQVFESLISNALKFVPPNAVPRLVIGAQPEGDRIAYFVKDSGVGFETRYKEKLFKPFVKLHSAKSYPGMGLGLAIAHWIVVNCHAGRIWSDTQLDNGSTFYFSMEALPCVDR